MEHIDSDIKKLKKEILNLLVGKGEDRVLTKKDVLNELDKPLINATENVPPDLFRTDTPESFERLTLSEKDLKEFLTVFKWFKVAEERICFSNPEPDVYYVHYDPRDETIKNMLDAFFDLFTAKFVRMAARQTVELSDRNTWKWSDVLVMFEKGLKSKNKTKSSKV